MGGVMLARSPYIPFSISFAMVGTSARRSSNKSVGVAQSSPMTATLGPCCMSLVSLRSTVRRADGGRARATGATRGSRILPATLGRFGPEHRRGRAGMAFLRRALQLFAAVWGACGLAIAVTPRWILVTWFDQVPYPDYTYVRVCGIAGLSSAALALMISRRLNDVWWWSWAFVLEA